MSSPGCPAAPGSDPCRASGECDPAGLPVRVAVHGIESTTITVEISAGGIPPQNEDKKIQTFYFLVGLPDNAVKEGWQRIEAALKNSNLRMQRMKLVVNLAPADLRKEGAAYDLPIAVGVYAASNSLIFDDLEKYIIVGELSLDGSVRPIKGALPIAIQARQEKFKGLILPKANAKEAAIVNDLEVYGVENVREAIEFFSGTRQLERTIVDTRAEFAAQNSIYDVDFFGRSWTTKYQTRPRNSRRRWSQCHFDWSARCRQNNAFEAFTDHFAAFELVRGFGNNENPLRFRHFAARSIACRKATVSRTAPYD